MASNYSVDEILEEVRRKKRAAQTPARPNTPKPPGSDGKPTVSFKFAGLTDEFDRPSSAIPQTNEPAQKNAADRATRVDIPIVHTFDTSDDTANDASSTRVIPALRPEGSDDLERRRQERVRQFMQDSFAADNAGDEPEMPAAPDESELSRFFGGLRPRAAKEKDQTEKSAAPFEKTAKEKDEKIEYTDAADMVAVADALAANASRLSFQIMAMGVCFFVSLYLSLCNLFAIPLPDLICPENNLPLYLTVNLLVLAAACVLSASIIGSGMISLFTLKPSHDAPVALAVLATFAQSAAMIANPDFLHLKEGTLYFCVAILALWFSAIGRRMQAVRIRQNFAIASAASAKTGVFLLFDDPLATQLTEGQGPIDPAVAYSAPVEFPSDFVRLSNADTDMQSISRTLAASFLIFAMLLSLLSFRYFKNAMNALTVFCVVLCIASPLTLTMVSNLPLFRACRYLNKRGAFVSGYEAVAELSEVDAVTLDASEIYPAQTVVLHGIKPFAQSRIDEAILDAASAMCSVDGLLKSVFLEMIGHKTGMLKPVSAMTYEDQKGLRAVVDGKPVLIGNRELMLSKGIDTPSQDFEQKFVKSDRDILYLANSGEVTAMFVLSYKPNEEMAAILSGFAKREIRLVVRSTDPNITARKIAEDYQYPEEFIRIIPAQEQEAYAKLTAPRERAQALLIAKKGMPGARMRALAAVLALRQSIRLGMVLQLTGLILGYGLTAYLALADAIGTMGFLQLMIFQLFWAVCVILLPNMRKI
jgi:cation transport ATPase